MFRQFMIAAAIGLSTAGAPFAQTSDSSGSTAPDAATGAASAPGVLNDATKMKPFYTDENMQTLRAPSELEAAFQAMNTEDREAIAKECQNVTTQRDSFCKAFNEANPN